MYNEEDISETVDERNDHRLHQQHRYVVKTAKTTNQIFPRDTSCINNIIKRNRMIQSKHKLLPKIVRSSTKKTRLPARSLRRDESVIPDDDVLYGLCDDYTEDQFERSDNRYSLKSKINHAIQEKDVDYLFVLLKQRTTCPKSHRLWSKDRSRSTVLSKAMITGDLDCIQTILYAIDCGYLPQTLIDHVDLTGRTALWHACLKGNMSLVQQLIEAYGANVNQCGVLIVAAQNGHEEIVQFLLDHGCDPNRYTRNYNERALHAASRRNHIGIVRALLQHGADPTILDKHKRTALDYAIHKKYINIAKLLIEYQGDRFFKAQNGFTPLMLAAQCNNTPIVQLFSKILPEQQFLDELSLVACNYIIAGNAGKRAEAYCYFEKALSRTRPVCNDTLNEAYQFRRECQTLDELALIRDDDDAMRMHALLVSERLLLQRNEIGHFLSLIIKQSNVYTWKGRLDRCLQLQMYAYHLILQAEHDHRHSPLLHKKYLWNMASTLLQIVQTKGTAPVQLLALVWRWTLNRSDNSFTPILFKLIFLAIYLMEQRRLEHDEERLLVHFVRRTIRRNCTMPSGYYIFTHCMIQISEGLTNFTFGSLKVPTKFMVRMLIEYGADVDEVDPNTKSFPLHLICNGTDVDAIQWTASSLLDANAHTDYIDQYGNLPGECTGDMEIKEFLRTNRKLSLKCRCAHVINSEKVPYDNHLPKSLITFVKRHGTGKSRIVSSMWEW